MAEEMMTPEEMEPWILTDEEGNEMKFEAICTVPYEDAVYFALAPAEEIDGIAMDEYVLFRLVIDENGEETLATIENEEEWEAVADLVDQLLGEVEDHDE